MFVSVFIFVVKRVSLFLSACTVCCQIFKQISNRIAFDLEFAGIERNTSGCLRPYPYRVINIIRTEACCFNFLRGKVPGQLVDDGTDDFQVGEFFGAYIVLRNVPN